MGMLRLLRPTLVLLILVTCRTLGSAVSFDETVGLVYDVAPTLRITGRGFHTLDPSDLRLSFAPDLLELEHGRDFSLKIESSAVMLITLEHKRRWMALEPGAPPTALYLSTVTDGEDILLCDPVQVATVVPAPSVEVSHEPVFMKTTPRVIVNGNSFNPENTELLFDPPLEQGKIIHKLQIPSKKQIVLTKIFKTPYEEANTWRPEPGLLRIVAINTGAGWLSLNPDGRGITVADVQPDRDSSEAPDPSADGKDYSTQSHHQSLDMHQQQQHRSIGTEKFGGGRTVITPSASAAAGATDVAGGGGGRPSIIEDPGVTIYRTHTNALRIRGIGFDIDAVAPPVLDFDPPLDPVAFRVDVVTPTIIRVGAVDLLAEWSTPETHGPLRIKGIDAGHGMVAFDSPVTVATIVPDPNTLYQDAIN